MLGILCLGLDHLEKWDERGGGEKEGGKGRREGGRREREGRTE